MGTDLYWKITPKPKEETYNGLSRATWQFLADYMDTGEENLDELIFDRNRLPHLGIIQLTAKASGNMDLSQDITDLINAIKKYDSITLNVRG